MKGEMATFKTKINLWVRSEIFAYGALPVPPHPRLSVHVRTSHFIINVFIINTVVLQCGIGFRIGCVHVVVFSVV